MRNACFVRLYFHTRRSSSVTIESILSANPNSFLDSLLSAATFKNFFHHLSSSRYYVGFGTWIGPTLFFASQLVDTAYGIEADPVAFAKVESNLALNMDKDWARKVRINPVAVLEGGKIGGGGGRGGGE